MQKNSPDVTKFLNILSCYGFRPLTDYDLHATHCKGSVLDAFFIHGGYKPNLHGELLNNLQVIDETGTDSDHYLITATLDLMEPVETKSTKWIKKTSKI